MEIIYGIQNISTLYPRPILAIGVFDGLHKGHQKLIKYLNKKAKHINGTRMIMTFAPHPAYVVNPKTQLKMITSLAYRLKLMEEMGIDVCIVVKFTKSLSKLPAEKFIKKYLFSKIKPTEIVIGSDFHFGHERQGTIETLQEHSHKNSYKVFVFPATIKGHKQISSSMIRQSIAKGQLNKASCMLNRSVSILGRVVAGEGRGRGLGFPTANLNPRNEILPPNGVYIVQVEYKKKSYSGLANIGTRPTFQKAAKVNIEVYIFKFSKNIYNQDIVVKFLKKIRDEKYFLSHLDLITQMQLDVKKAKIWLKKHSVQK